MLSWVSVCPPVSMKVFVTALAIAAESPCLSSRSSTPIGFTSSLSSSVPLVLLFALWQTCWAFAEVEGDQFARGPHAGLEHSSIRRLLHLELV